MPHRILYLVRHGIAEPAGPDLSDHARRLTSEGVRKMRSGAAGLKLLGVMPDALLTSPLRRAVETADVLAEVLGEKLSVREFALLAPGGEPEDVLTRLCEIKGEALMLVGHQPDMGDLASYLLTGSTDEAPLPFKKGAVAAIELPDASRRCRGALLWFLTPKQLRLIGGSE